MTSLRFYINDELIEESEASPNTTLLRYLRDRRGLTGAKEGCAEGDCGACTVVISGESPAGEPLLRAVNSCLFLLPMAHGRRVYTVEGLARNGTMHAVQQAAVDTLSSQCGFCTPGVVMSLLEAHYRDDLESNPAALDDQLCGNLCRCTGYRPIREALVRIAGKGQRDDDIAGPIRASPPVGRQALTYEADGELYQAPGTLDEALSVLAAEPRCRIVSGGTDLSLEVTKAHRRFPRLLSLENVPELRAIGRDADSWHFGAAVPLADIEQATADTFPPLARMLRYFGSRQIKHRATLGGNLCTASPIGDCAPVLLSLGARLRLRSREGARELPLDELYTGYRATALLPGEILTDVTIPLLPADARASAYKVSKRRELDISAVSAGMLVRIGPASTITEARIAFGGMAAIPKRALAVERELVGRPWTGEVVARAVAALEQDFTPIDDHRASAWYRMSVACNLLCGFFEETRARHLPALPPLPSSTLNLESAP
ncbi:MAG: xanthine dehydrogenase small subunit [Candidatus Schekmanbacteria bacterium]|nr:xanthine dehydrogenase small subunit [Candidatus Schekmanbacteria bacterium]